MAGKPYQSCLIPYENEIIALRRKRPPIPYSRIAALLREKYQIAISNDGIREFVKRRAKKVSKTCKYAWDVELPETTDKPTTEAKVIEKPTALPKQSAVLDKPKQSVVEEDDDDDDFSDIPNFKEVMKYSDNYNLTLMSPEEAARMEERIKKKRAKEEREKQKQKEKEKK